MVNVKSLGKVIQELPEELRNEVEDFVYYIRERRLSNGKRSKEFDFDRLVGMGLRAPLNPNPQFKSEDDLWG